MVERLCAAKHVGLVVNVVAMVPSLHRDSYEHLSCKSI